MSCHAEITLLPFFTTDPLLNYFSIECAQKVAISIPSLIYCFYWHTAEDSVPFGTISPINCPKWDDILVNVQHIHDYMVSGRMAKKHPAAARGCWAQRQGGAYAKYHTLPGKTLEPFVRIYSIRKKQATLIGALQYSLCLAAQIRHWQSLKKDPSLTEFTSGW